jgi:hypothetical protein
MPGRTIARTMAALISLAACAPHPSFARAAKDILVMKNGDRITCEVKGLEAGVLRASLDYVDGTISIDWLKVARVESNYLFVVLLQDGSTYSAKVISPETNTSIVKLIIQPEGEQKSFEVDRSSVVRLAQTSESFLQQLSGSFTVGATYAKGNSTTQFNFGSDLAYLRTNWGAQVAYNSNLSSSTGAPTATRNQLDFSAYRFLRWKNDFVGGLTDFLQSSVQGISRQAQAGAGLGRFFKNTNRVSFWILGGLGVQRTVYVRSIVDQAPQNIGVAVISSRLQVFTFKQTRLSFTSTVFPALTQQPGRLFIKTNASYYLKLFHKIDWNLSFYGSWDTQPPPQFRGSDYGTSTGLSWTFGNK